MARKEALDKISLAENHAVLLPYEFINDVAKEALHANTRFVAHTMQLDNDEISSLLLDIYKSLGEGVVKQLYIDDFAHYVIGQDMVEVGRLIPWQRRKIEEKQKEKQELFDKFEQAGVELIFTNPILSFKDKLVPTTGRDHLKGIFIDDSVAYLGGLNLDAGTADRAEIMVKFKGESAKKISTVFDHIRDCIKAGEADDDFIAELDEDTSLIYDSGQAGKSTIIEEAVNIIDAETDTIYLTSYFLPDGEVAKALKRARDRGVVVNIVSYKPVLEAPFSANIDNLVWAADKSSRLKAVINGTNGLEIQNNQFRQVHAKLLIAKRNVDGLGVAMFGTNNLSERGVSGGTREVHVVTRDQELVANLSTKYHDFENETKTDQISLVI